MKQTLSRDRGMIHLEFVCFKCGFVCLFVSWSLFALLSLLSLSVMWITTKGSTTSSQLCLLTALVARFLPLITFHQPES